MNLSKKNIDYSVFLSPNSRLFLLILFFSIFLTPLSLTVRGDNVSVNYSFILFPLLCLIMGETLNQPRKIILTLISVYVVIFLSCLIYQYYYIEFWERRLISFLLFMSMFTFFVVKIDIQMITAFKYSVILVSFLYSCNSLYIYISNGGSSLGYELMRPIVQSQRYGFILLLGLWLTIFESTRSRLGLSIKLLIIIIIFNGLGLTFSRSSVAGLLASTFTYLLLLLPKFKFHGLKFRIDFFYLLLLYFGIIALIVTASYYCIPDYFQFFSERLLKISITPQIEGYFSYPKYPSFDTYVYNQLESSEGYRVFMIIEILRYLSINPLFGSGFLGVWIMFADLSGASHNQLLDVLFRTGVIGFSAFLFILYKLFQYNFRIKNNAIIVSMVGILFIGLFHETFKLSQGAFIFSFLIAQAFSDSGAERSRAKEATVA
jgi:hypothetical protein